MWVDRDPILPRSPPFPHPICEAMRGGMKLFRVALVLSSSLQLVAKRPVSIRNELLATQTLWRKLQRLKRTLAAVTPLLAADDWHADHIPVEAEDSVDGPIEILRQFNSMQYQVTTAAMTWVERYWDQLLMMH